MNGLILRVAALALISSLQLGATSIDAAGPQIWLAPQASVPPSRLSRAADFMDMFEPDAPWQKAASHVAVFKLYASFVSRASDDQMAQIVADLNRRGIAIALEAGVMNVAGNPPPPCGGLGLVEGYGTVAQARNIADKIQRAGGRLAYLAMDEPFFYGHYFTHNPASLSRGQGCGSSPQEIAALIVPVLDVYLAAFPDVAIGDVEPTGYNRRFADWQTQLEAWTTGYRSAMGRPMAFMQLDVQWPLPDGRLSHGIEDALSVYSYTQELVREGLIRKIGIIYNGTPQDRSDADWVRAARAHIVLMETQNGVRPDQAIIQSWNPAPTHAMPDSASDTLTSLVNFYVSRQP